MEKKPTAARVASATPGRVRLRLAPDARQPELAQQIQKHFQAQDGVQRVTTNPATGSVVVHYDHHAVSHADLLDSMHDIGVIVEEVMAGEPTEVFDGTQHSDSAHDVIRTFQRIDDRLLRATNHRLDLKLLFPIGLFAIGMRQILTRGLGVTEVPAYVLLWYAFDSFWKFHRQPPITDRPHRRTRGTNVASTIEADTDAAVNIAAATEGAGG